MIEILSEEAKAKAYMGSDYHPSFRLGLEVKHGIERVAQEAKRYTLEQVVDKIIADMPTITDSATYLRKLVQELKKQAEGK